MAKPFPCCDGTPLAADAELPATDDLAMLLTDPSRVARVPVQQLPALLVRLASVHTRFAAIEAAVAARLLVAHAPQSEPDRLLTADEAVYRLGVTKDWLRRRGTLPFVVKLSEGVVRYSAAGIDAFIEMHRRRHA
jgi:hypothetical protein